jgi:hypothetical protein
MPKDTVTWNEDPAHFAPRGRRDFIRVGALGGLGLTLGDFFRAQDANAAQKFYESKEGPAKSIIHLTLGGGMAAQETWDPKPDSPIEYRGPFGVVKTKIPGVVLSENMKNLAGVADKMSIIRSVAGKEADHGRASYTMFTGYRMSPAITHPSLGSVISHEFGPRNNLPPYVAVPNANQYGGTGYLSSQFGAFGVGGDPARGANNFSVRDLTLPQGIDDSRFDRRRSMRDAVEDHFKSLETNSDAINAMDEFYQRAYTMISSESAREAFELRKESKQTIKKYGESQPGMRLLLARRLVEAGVRFVTVGYGGWDHHSRISDAMNRSLPPLDQALAALVSDLDERGLLDSTLIVVSSEFGRTPKINASGGRDHYARVFSMALAGGGIKRGYVHGSSDATSSEPEESPVTVPDVLTTVYKQMGIVADKELMAPGGRPIEIIDGGKVVPELIG